MKEKTMNKKVKSMKEEIKRRGGIVHVSDELPDEVAERFLAEILDCPDCRDEARVKERKREH